MSPTAPATRQRGPLPRTPPQPKAKRSAAVKSSPTGPRAARREAVPLDSLAQRSYPNHPRPHSPNPWVRRCGRSIKGSDTPQSRRPPPRRHVLVPRLPRSDPHQPPRARGRPPRLRSPPAPVTARQPLPGQNSSSLPSVSLPPQHMHDCDVHRTHMPSTRPSTRDTSPATPPRRSRHPALPPRRRLLFSRLASLLGSRVIRGLLVQGPRSLPGLA
jgi:hypothetical protein